MIVLSEFRRPEHHLHILLYLFSEEEGERGGRKKKGRGGTEKEEKWRGEGEEEVIP